MKHDNPKHVIAICVSNKDYEMSLEVRKAYPVINDPRAETHNYIRLIDETGEDYLFPASRFVLVQVDAAVEDALLAAA